MKTPSTKTRCPRCNSRGTPIKGGQLKCKGKYCGAIYDGNNEGIVATHIDPVKSLECKEREESRR